MSDSKDMGNASYLDRLWAKTYTEIKNKHDEAFAAIEQAISLEEREKPNEAIEKYKEGIRLIDEALALQVQYPDNPDLTWEKATVMIQKIKKTRAEVLTRISIIQRSIVPETPPEDPPSYEEAVASSSSSEVNDPKTYKELAEALHDLSIDPNQCMSQEIIYTHDNVRLYFISPNREVLSTQLPETLTISLVQGEEPNTPRAILQIGSWIYPLVPGVSPCYRTDYGAFILPNVHTDIPGSSVGIILPSDADQEVFDILENILHGIISQTTEQGIEAERKRRQQAADVSARISSGIVNGAWYLSQGLIKGAQKASEFFDSSTPKIINNIQPSEQPAQIPEKLSKGVHIAEAATNKAAQVTGYVAEKVGTATMRLGHFLAPHIQKQGTKLLTTGFKMSEEDASDKMRGVLTVAAGAVEGFSTVYRGLHTSSTILATNLKNNTVKIVKHKYGSPAATVTGGTLTTIGNVYCISNDAKILKPKRLALNTVKDTTTAMTYEYSSSCRGRDHYENLPGSSKEIKKSDNPNYIVKGDEDEKKGLK